LLDLIGGPDCSTDRATVVDEGALATVTWVERVNHYHHPCVRSTATRRLRGTLARKPRCRRHTEVRGGRPHGETKQVPIADFIRGVTVSDVTNAPAARMGRQQVLEIVQTQLADILDISPDTIIESSSFADDLDADSLALIELVEALEDALRDVVPGFRIDDDDLEDLRTVRDAVDYVTAKIERS
jgi:acyl carrier protein